MKRPAESPKVPVWDVLVRVLHWSLAAGVVCAWVTGHWSLRGHETVGYVATGIVLARLAWGFCGTPFARFGSFFASPHATWRYTRQFWAGNEPRHLGHNPLGGWMVLALLATAGAVCITGILYTTEWLWGYAWLEALHRILAWMLAGLIPLHLAGVALTSWRHRENLVAAMFTGKKRRIDDRPA